MLGHDWKGHGVFPEFETRFKSWMDAPESGVDGHGRYPYSCEGLGIDDAWVEELIADNGIRFGLA